MQSHALHRLQTCWEASKSTKRLCEVEVVKDTGPNCAGQYAGIKTTIPRLNLAELGKGIRSVRDSQGARRKLQLTRPELPEGQTEEI